MKKPGGTDWEARFANGRQPEVKVLDKPFAGIPAGSRMLVVTPPIVDDLIRRIPPGHVMDLREVCRALAGEHGAEAACPVTTGLSLRVVAERAYQRSLRGEDHVTPFWRAVDPDSPLAGKLMSGRDFIREKRQQERGEAGVTGDGRVG